MSLATVIIGAVVPAAAGLGGALIGARATRRASVEALRQAADEENERWRTALYHECLHNVRAAHERPPGGRWTLETSVLRDYPAHAGALAPQLLERVARAKSLADHLEAAVANMRPDGVLYETRAPAAPVADLRQSALAEVREIEKALRPNHSTTART